MEIFLIIILGSALVGSIMAILILIKDLKNLESGDREILSKMGDCLTHLERSNQSIENLRSNLELNSPNLPVKPVKPNNFDSIRKAFLRPKAKVDQDSGD